MLRQAIVDLQAFKLITCIQHNANLERDKEDVTIPEVNAIID